MEEETGSAKRYAWIAFALVVIIGAAFLLTRGCQKEYVDDACCERVCGAAGLTCDAVFNDEVSCALDYARYGHPGMSEIFKFRIHDPGLACAEAEDGD